LGQPGEQAGGALAERLGLDLRAVTLLRRNDYCEIFRAVVEGEPVVVKQYLTGDPELARREAQAIAFYHEVADGDPSLIPARLLALNPETRTFCMSWVQGELLSRLLLRAGGRADLERRSVVAMERLGRLLAELHGRTAARDAAPSPFLLEYIVHASRRLERVPLLGRTLFRGYEAESERLYDALCAAGTAPSFAHGDLVPANIVLDGERIGLIDFANTNRRSHLLNDVYGLRIGAESSPFRPALRAELVRALYRGLGRLDFPDAVHRFHWEYHRRRWLSLKLASGNARATALGLVGLRTLRAPYSSDIARSGP
jgi:Ser/Thr protein kinase RdoA (MazF antagonist)